jgi:hypothetical protein
LTRGRRGPLWKWQERKWRATNPFITLQMAERTYGRGEVDMEPVLRPGDAPGFVLDWGVF